MDLRINVADVADEMMTYLYSYRDLQSVWNKVVSDVVKDQISFDEVVEYINEKVELGKQFKNNE